MLLLIAGILSADVFGQSGHLYIEQLAGETRINGRPAQAGTDLATVSLGDIIATGSCSQARLHTSNGSLLLGPSASLTVSPIESGGSAQNLRLQLNRGGFSLETPRVQGNPAEIVPNVVLRTPESELTAYHGLIKGAVTGNEGTLVIDVYGQATIRGSDGTIVSTDQYGARLVQLRNGYQPEKFRPGANALLGLVLDAISPPCVTRALGDAAENRLIDVGGISFCEGPGWENCTRRQRILEVTGIGAASQPDIYLPVHVRTVEVDGSAATPGEGWEIGYAIYRAGDVSSPVKNTSGRLRYDEDDSGWRSHIRTPSQAGKYEVYLTLYCSRQWDRCGTYQYVEWKEKLPIEVVCSSAGCVSQSRRQANGSYITSTESYSTPAGIIRRASGELVVLIEETSNQKRILHSTVSTDQGNSWSPLMPVDEFMLGSAVTETANGMLMLVAICPRSSDWCFYQSHDAQRWTQESVLQLPTLQPVLPDTRTEMGVGVWVGLMSSPPVAESIIQDREGTYLVSYMRSEQMTSDVYVRQSRDLKQWSEPVRVSAGQGINRLSRVTQRESGAYALAYYSRSHESVIVSESADGVTWTITQSAPVGRRPSDLKILEDDGQLGLLLAFGGNVQIIYPAANAVTRTPLHFGQVQGDIRLLTVLEANQLIGAVFIDHSDERQDVLFTPIKALHTN